MGLSLNLGSSSSTSLGGSNPLAGATAAGAQNTSTLSSAASQTALNFPTTMQLPSWLNTDPNSIMGELSKSYDTAPGMITDAANKAGALAKESADQAYGQSMRQGQNATKQLSNVSRQQGGTAKTSSIVAGEMAEDAGKNRTDARVQIAQMKLGATEQAASLSSQIATSMASLRSSYLSTLAGTNTNLRGQDVGLVSNLTSTGSQNAAEVAQTQAANAAAAAKKAAGTTQEGYYGDMGSGSGAWLGPLSANNGMSSVGG